MNKKMLATGAATALLVAAGWASANHGSGYGDASLLHLHDDVVRDGQADILFRRGSALAFWQLGSPMGGAAVAAAVHAGAARPQYRVVAVSDFDGDRSADVMWTNGYHLELWLNNGAGGYTAVPVGKYGGGWTPFAAGDVNGDGRSDLFFRRSTQLAYWQMDGANVVARREAGDAGAGYRVVAIADFTGRDANGARSVDVLWTNGTELKTWVGNPVTGMFQSHALGSYGGGWVPFAAADINGDAIADILFRNGTHIAYWRQRYRFGFAGFEYTSGYAGDGGPGFRVVSVSDYGKSDSADEHHSDLLWTNGSHAKLWIGWCRRWDWDEGCLEQEFIAHDLGTYYGGWEPLELLIPQ